MKLLFKYEYDGLISSDGYRWENSEAITAKASDYSSQLYKCNKERLELEDKLEVQRYHNKILNRKLKKSSAIQFAYHISDKVDVIPLSCDGTVVALAYEASGAEYRVRYIFNSQIRYDFFREDELRLK